MAHQTSPLHQLFLRVIDIKVASTTHSSCSSLFTHSLPTDRWHKHWNVRKKSEIYCQNLKHIHQQAASAWFRNKRISHSIAKTLILSLLSNLKALERWKEIKSDSLINNIPSNLTSYHHRLFHYIMERIRFSKHWYWATIAFHNTWSKLHSHCKRPHLFNSAIPIQSIAFQAIVHSVWLKDKRRRSNTE